MQALSQLSYSPNKMILIPPNRELDGGAKRDRTADLLHAMQALSQLSYSPNKMILIPPNRELDGGAKRDRTADLLHAMQALSQLSYSPKQNLLDGGHNIQAMSGCQSNNVVLSLIAEL